MKSTRASTGWGHGSPLSGSAWPEWVSAAGPTWRGLQGPLLSGGRVGQAGRGTWCPTHTSVSRMTPGPQLHTGLWEGSVVVPCVSSGPPPPGHGPLATRLPSGRQASEASSTAPHALFLPELSPTVPGEAVFHETVPVAENAGGRRPRGSSWTMEKHHHGGVCPPAREVGAGGDAAQALPPTCPPPGGPLPGSVCWRQGSHPWACVPGRAPPEDTLARLPARQSRCRGRNLASAMGRSGPGCVCECVQVWLPRRRDVSTGSCDGDRLTGRAVTQKSMSPTHTGSLNYRTHARTCV